VAAASAAGLFALLAVLWWPEPESAREVMPPPPAPARQRDVQPAPPVPARVESRLARLVLTSTPAGAMVHKGNQFLCNTPCDIEMAATGDAEMLRLRLKGHQDAAVEVPLMPGLAVRREVRLEALPVKSPGRGGARPEAPARPRGGTPPRDDLPGLRLDEAGGK
jgi:hypothetical protein